MSKPRITEFTGVTNDITRQYIGPLLQSKDTVLLEQGGGDYAIYEALLIDSQVHSCFGQYADRIIKCETVVESASESKGDVAIADFVRENMKRLEWDEITRAMLYARIFGYAVSEVVWRYDADRVWFQDIKVRSQRRFKFDVDQRLRHLTLQNVYEGEVMPDRKFWTFSMGGTTTDNPYGLGSGHQLYWPVLIKRMGTKSWLKFLDKFAQPFILVRHSDNARPEEIERALELADSFAEDSCGAASERTVIELIESQRSGGANYADICERMDQSISKILLSQTMTTDNGSSRSQAQVHDTVAVAAIKSAADLVCSSFNRGPITWLVQHNFGHDVKIPRVWRRTEPDDDLLLQAQVDEKLTAIGYKPSIDHVVSVYGEGYRPPVETDNNLVLNETQIDSLKQIIGYVLANNWSDNLATTFINTAFPGIDSTLIDALSTELKNKKVGATIEPNIPADGVFNG